MKKMIFTLVTMLAIAVSSSAMSYEQARNEALFLTDKMAYELNLTDAQYEAAYEINLDYLMSVTDYNDVAGIYWERRNLDMSYILYSWQWEAFRAATYFYRPLTWDGSYWHFGIYVRYPRRDYFYFGRPAFYVSYRGGHSWRHNGGRSYYEGRRDVFRPGHVERDHHFGMRSGWDRGDYRNHHGNSSTRITGPGRGDNPGRHHNDRGYRNDRGGHNDRGGNNNDRGFRNDHSGNSGSGHFNGSRSGVSGDRSGGFNGGHSGSDNRPVNTGSGSFGGNRNSGSSSHSTGSSNSFRSGGNSSRSFGGSSSSHSGGSYSGSSSNRSTHSSGSFSGSNSSRSSHSSGSFSGGSSSRSAGSHSGGSRSGGSSTRGGGDSHHGGSRR